MALKLDIPPFVTGPNSTNSVSRFLYSIYHAADEINKRRVEGQEEKER